MIVLQFLAVPARWCAPVLALASLSTPACTGDSGFGGDAFVSGAGSTDGVTAGDTRSDITATTIDPSASLSTTMPDATVGDATASDTTTPVSTDGGGSTAAESAERGQDASSTTDAGESSPSSSEGGSSSPTAGCASEAIGNYDACLDARNVPDSRMCGFAGAICINDGATPAAVSACSQSVCVDECDCPAAPATGDSVVTCDDIAGDDMTPECFLDCSGGETCPDDMGCFAGLLCVHDSGAGGDDYGACETGAVCPLGDTCIVDDPDAVEFGACSAQGCANAGDCPAAPATGNAVVVCEEITGSVNDCFLDCSFGETCPDGMQCYGGFICMWPV